MDICYHPNYRKVHVKGALINCRDCTGAECTVRVRDALSNAGITSITGIADMGERRLCASWQTILRDADMMATQGNEELLRLVRELDGKMLAQIRYELRMKSRILVLFFIAAVLAVGLIISMAFGKTGNWWFVTLVLFFMVLVAALYDYGDLMRRLRRS